MSTENVEHIIIEHLKAIRSDIGKLTSGIDGLTVRIGSLESHVAGFRRDLSLIHEDIAVLHHRGDEFNSRLTRIEKKLELAN